MPRAPAFTDGDVIKAAMFHFWRHGYHATSMDALVAATGASRHAIYSGIGSKRALYLQAFDAYQSLVVTPAFSRVEQPAARLDAADAFFDAQIAAAEQAGLPGPGCFVANAMTETAPHDPQINAEVARHHARLRAGFANALAGENSAFRTRTKDLNALADFLVVAAQGLWSMSRMVTSAQPLRAHVATLLSLVRARVHS